jgi:hypothetical protein
LFGHGKPDVSVRKKAENRLEIAAEPLPCPWNALKMAVGSRPNRPAARLAGTHRPKDASGALVTQFRRRAAGASKRDAAVNSHVDKRRILGHIGVSF